MISWLWLIPAVMVGACIGVVVIALCVAAKSDEEDV
jgi:hypothetical protein